MPYKTHIFLSFLPNSLWHNNWGRLLQKKKKKSLTLRGQDSISFSRYDILIHSQISGRWKGKGTINISPALQNQNIQLTSMGLYKGVLCACWNRCTFIYSWSPKTFALKQCKMCLVRSIKRNVGLGTKEEQACKNCTLPPKNTSVNLERKTEMTVSPKSKSVLELCLPRIHMLKS